jgi:hypothetical protein
MYRIIPGLFAGNSEHQKLERSSRAQLHGLPLLFNILASAPKSAPSIMSSPSSVFVAALTTAMLSSHAVAMPNFVWHVPNGANLPGSPAIGHDLSDFPHRNAFGQDFEGAGFKWTKELCELDSDMDGQSNGLELGDPCCEWAIGSSPEWTTGISHPGDATQTSDPSRVAAISCFTTSSESESDSSESGFDDEYA